MVIAKIVRETGLYLVPKIFKAFQKYDVKIHRGLYGKSGGMGVRHGRDAGAAVGSLLSLGSNGDDLDGVQPSGSPYETGKKYQTRGGRKVRRSVRARDYCPSDRDSRYRRRR